MSDGKEQTRWKGWLRAQARAFRIFVYNKETRECLGRGLISWLQILGFYLMFYTAIAGIFAVHLAVFVVLTPGPGRNTKPWNYGRYGYPNYPNSKTTLVAIPEVITCRGLLCTLNSNTKQRIEELTVSANHSGVITSCFNQSTNYGFDIGKPCAFLHIARVYEWTPSDINSTLSSYDHLPLNCSVISNLGIQASVYPVEGIPLNLSNNANSRSFPYIGQDGYLTPMIGVTLDITSIIYPSLGENRVTVKCSLDLAAIGMPSLSNQQLDRLYEIPSDSEILLKLQPSS